MFGRNKFKKLKREDVVNAIIDQTKQQEDLENGILQKSEEVERLLERGRKEKNRDVKLLCAKKVNTLQEEIQRDTKRAAFLLYNVKLLERLKAAVDDNRFIENTTKLPLNKLLCDQKALAQFCKTRCKTVPPRKTHSSARTKCSRLTNRRRTQTQALYTLSTSRTTNFLPCLKCKSSTIPKTNSTRTLRARPKKQASGRN